MHLLSLRGNRFPLEWETLLRVRDLAAARPSLKVELLGPPASAAADGAPASGGLGGGGSPGQCSQVALSRLLSSGEGPAAVAGSAAGGARGAEAGRPRLARGGSGSDWSVSSDDLCGVCFDRPNSLHVLGCGHLLCVPCYRRLLRTSPPAGSSAAAGAPWPCCPFCRGRIDGFAYASWVQAAAEAHLALAPGGGGAAGAGASPT
ncbi:MAG: hypothetical protein J3K34DRAFT_447023 [Monoraphidium minutum]|nr:MAG: hypothetical protein J3K34DRAFT_447023 [Monoraphidium minutum]